MLIHNLCFNKSLYGLFFSNAYWFYLVFSSAGFGFHFISYLFFFSFLHFNWYSEYVLFFVSSCNSKFIWLPVKSSAFSYLHPTILNDRFTRDFVSFGKNQTNQTRNKNIHFQRKIKNKTIKRKMSFHHLQWFFCPSILLLIICCCCCCCLIVFIRFFYSFQ